MQKIPDMPPDDNYFSYSSTKTHMHAVGTQMKLKQLQLKGKKILTFLRSNIVLNMTNEIHTDSLLHSNHYGRIFLRISSMDNLIRHEILMHLYLSFTCTNPAVPS